MLTFATASFSDRGGRLFSGSTISRRGVGSASPGFDVCRGDCAVRGLHVDHTRGEPAARCIGAGGFHCARWVERSAADGRAEFATDVDPTGVGIANGRTVARTTNAHAYDGAHQNPEA